MAGSAEFVKLVQLCNRFHFGANLHKNLCKPFMVGSQQVGLIRPDVLRELTNYPNVFRILKEQSSGEVKCVCLVPELKTFEQRSEKIREVIQDLKQKDIFITLKGWRNECYNVWHKFSEPPLFKMERSATCLLGVVQYGVHINGFTRHPDLGLCMWIAKRSQTKPTYPGKLDQMAAGGLASGLGILECCKKECQEEASVPDYILDKLRPAGCVSYFHEDERGLFPENQFIYDLELPITFIPVNADGEAESFQLLPINEVRKLIGTDMFKFNCALVILDFLIRHGLVTPDEEPNYSYIIQNMHSQPW